MEQELPIQSWTEKKIFNSTINLGFLDIFSNKLPKIVIFSSLI